jgi:tetratricopeptide (TPR) repeat protein
MTSNTYNSGFVIPVRSRGYLTAAAVLLPMLAGVAARQMLPEAGSVPIWAGILCGVLAAGAVRLLSLPSVQFVLDHDRLIHRARLSRPVSIRFDEIISIQAGRDHSASKLIVTRVYGGPVTQIYETPRVQPAAKGLASLREALKGWLGINKRPYTEISISSNTERYQELLAELIRHSPSALVDPTSRVFAEFASFVDPYKPIVPTSRDFRGMDAARTYLGDFDQSKAQKALESLLESEPHNLEARYLLGRLFLACQDWYNAVPQLELASALDPENPRILFHLGFAYYCQGDFQESYAKLNASHKLKPLANEEATFLNCAALHRGMRDESEKACQALERQTAQLGTVKLIRRCAACTQGITKLPDDPRARIVLTILVGVAAAAVAAAGTLEVPLSRRIERYLSVFGIYVLVEFTKFAVQSLARRAEVHNPYPCWLDGGLTSVNRKWAEKLIHDPDGDQTVRSGITIRRTPAVQRWWPLRISVTAQSTPKDRELRK